QIGSARNDGATYNSVIVEHPMIGYTKFDRVHLPVPGIGQQFFQQRVISSLSMACARSRRCVYNHADILPGIPVDRDGERATCRGVVMGECVEEGIGGAIIYLAESSYDRAAR